MTLAAGTLSVVLCLASVCVPGVACASGAEKLVEVNIEAWQLVYVDGSANMFRFELAAGGGSGRVIFLPVTAASSSSGIYDGGTPQMVSFDGDSVHRLESLVTRLVSEENHHVERREKGTDTFTVIREGERKRFVVRSGTTLTAFREFAEPLRGVRGKPGVSSGTDDAAWVTREGVARRAKMGAMLQTEQGVVWVDLDEWPDSMLGARVRVRGRWSSRADLPVFVAEDGEPMRAGIPVPPGTDLKGAARREVLVLVSFDVLP